MLAAPLVVGDEPRLVAGADLPHLDAGLELRGDPLHEVAEVDPRLGGVVDREHLAAQDRLDLDDLHVEPELAGRGLDGLDLLPRIGLDRGPPRKIVDRRDAQDLAVGAEGVVAASGVLDVLEHLLPRDALAAARVGAGGRQHLDDFETAVGAGDELRAAAGLRGPVVGVLGDGQHHPVADHDARRRLEPGVDLRIRHRVAAGGIGIGFKDRKRKDRHERGMLPAPRHQVPA